MLCKFESEIGNVYINNEVIATIAGSSAMECYGLVGMASKSATDGFVKLLRKENMTKGVKVKIEDNSIVLDLYVIIQYGTRISVVADNIINKIKYNVENQTGMSVKDVNINIEGVRVLY